MTTLVCAGSVAAEANHGRWIGRCGWPIYCDGAATLQRFQQGFVCQSCGRATDVVWPSADMVEGVERLLTLRPHPKNRNWLPGESLHDLFHENAMHGVFAGGLPEGAEMLILDDRIAQDKLPATPARPELVR